MKSKSVLRGIAACLALVVFIPVTGAQNTEEKPNQVLEWNQIFIDTLIATNTPNSSSQRLGAIVHTAIFDAYNGIERRYTPVFVDNKAPRDASGRAAVIAAGYTALVGLFPTQKSSLDASYFASLAALSDHGGDGGKSRERGIAWGTEVAQAVLTWRSTDGFSGIYSAFTGGSAIGQWRPTPPAFGAMSAQALAYSKMFVLDSNSQFRPAPPRTLTSTTYTEDFNTVKEFGRNTPSMRTSEQTALAPFWEGNASTHWNQAANQMARDNHLSMSDCNRLLAVLNIAMADTAFTTWSAKRFYGDIFSEVTWRPVTSIPLADNDGNSSTFAESAWLPLVTTPSHPEYPAGHPSQNGAAATVLLGYFTNQQQTFTLTTGSTSRTYTSIAQARSDGNNARVWGGMHYPSTVAISDAEGEAIANYVNQTFMQRRHGKDKDPDKGNKHRKHR
ncbi:MAG TPA: vanadium-dependent haloperoxidase [Terriglobia bacterium]|nr:vanadium-dependent haloperoxidase [Terriglobia bacterium]